MLEPKAPVTLYYQLESLLRQDFATGGFKPGDAVASENDLAEKYDVSRVTVRRALDGLEEDGLIIRRRGARTLLSPLVAQLPKGKQGTTVFRGFEDELRDRGLSPHAELLEVTEGKVPDFIASMLEAAPSAEIVRIRRLGRIGTKPLWLESRFFPLDVGRAIAKADLTHESILGLIRQNGHEVVSVEMQIRPVIATPRQAKLLELPESQPLFLHESISYVKEREPVQVARVYLRGDLYKVVLTAEPYEDMPGLRLTSGGYVVTDAINGEDPASSVETHKDDSE
jgi:GntR family transcriptional regulator